MQLVTTKVDTNVYIQSEAEFSRARTKGFWETIWDLITGRQVHLVAFDQAVKTSGAGPTISLGLQDVPIERILGSVGRHRDFNRHFSPCTADQNSKERWRMIYTLAVTGKGFPAIALYKIDQDYFVKDGHHRVSVAKHLAWETIQAQVTLLPSPQTAPPSPNAQPGWCGEECLCP